MNTRVIRIDDDRDCPLVGTVVDTGHYIQPDRVRVLWDNQVAPAVEWADELAPRS